MSPTVFAIGAACGVLVTALAAAALRNRFYAVFVGVILGVQASIAAGIYAAFEPVWPLFVYLELCVLVHFLSLARARMRPLAFRALVSLPALFFAAGTLLALPFAIAAAFGVEPIGALGAFAIAGLGVWQSLAARREVVHLALDGAPVEGLRRHPKGRGADARPLRVVQITDPHLGPLMSVARLRGICERAAREAPDLVVITGDFLTMESQADPRTLADALAPLAALEGKVFACFGNHDHEAPHIVRNACAKHGIRLLVDDEASLETPAGPVQILGADFAFRDRRARLEALCAAFPRREGHLRLLLLHDPGAFRHVPDGEADLVLSGHTHGGQLGLLTLGLPWTFVSAFTSIPDHGVWAKGKNRLYVHRGTGVYGFPLRVGVPAEESVLCVHTEALAATRDEARPTPAA
ncbi:MAG: metallophosphoesterase [Sandaracinaceae bacterium]|nr:metallophosphoesterase [Sandaracinaceae bacterium]